MSVAARNLATLLLALIAVCGCDRFGVAEEADEEEIVPGETIGTFRAVAGTVNAGGYEEMEGPATFAKTDAVVIRLSSVFAFPFDTTTIVLRMGGDIPQEGTYAVSEDGMVAEYRSVLLQGQTATSESGELIVAESGRSHIRGSFDVIVFSLDQTAPDHFTRRRIRLRGTFHARAHP